MPATSDGTEAFAKRTSRHAQHFREAFGLKLSSLGLGSYLGKDDDATDALYAAAVQRALDRGVNVIDCAINYRHQRSERALGKGLKEAYASGKAKREEVFFCTKAGYLPFEGNLPPEPHKWLFRSYVESGIVAPNEVAGGCHCMTPKYLADQISRSLANTGLDSLDVLYVHNPEQQLEDVPLEEFAQRWKAACEELERQCDAGRIGRYGIATWNGLRVGPGQQGHLPLEVLWKIARAVAGEKHRFRVIQFPYNLAMLEAAFQETQVVQGNRRPLLAVAEELGFACFSSVPLLQGRLTKGMPENVKALYAGLKTDAQRALQFVRSTKGILALLAGAKTQEHVEENCEVLGEGLPGGEEFARLFSELP